MKHYLYKTTNILNGRYYVGRHSTEKEDSYMGSGVVLRKAIEKYGIENFNVEILEYFDDYEKLIEAEKNLVENALKDPLSYNLGPGGPGGSTKEQWDKKRKVRHSKVMSKALSKEKTRKKISEKVSELHETKGKDYWSKEGIDSKRKLMKGNTNKLGKKESEETKKKKRVAFANSEKFQKNIRRKRSKEEREKISRANKGKNTGSSNPMASAENRAKVAKSKIGRKRMISPEGKIFMVKKEEQQKKLQEGYIFSAGRK